MYTGNILLVFKRNSLIIIYIYIYSALLNCNFLFFCCFCAVFDNNFAPYFNLFFVSL